MSETEQQKQISTPGSLKLQYDDAHMSLIANYDIADIGDVKANTDRFVHSVAVMIGDSNPPITEIIDLPCALTQGDTDRETQEIVIVVTDVAAMEADTLSICSTCSKPKFQNKVGGWYCPSCQAARMAIARTKRGKQSDGTPAVSPTVSDLPQAVPVVIKIEEIKTPTKAMPEALPPTIGGSELGHRPKCKECGTKKLYQDGWKCFNCAENQAKVTNSDIKKSAGEKVSSKMLTEAEKRDAAFRELKTLLTKHNVTNVEPINIPQFREAVRSMTQVHTVRRAGQFYIVKTPTGYAGMRFEGDLAPGVECVAVCKREGEYWWIRNAGDSPTASSYIMLPAEYWQARETKEPTLE